MGPRALKIRVAKPTDCHRLAEVYQQSLDAKDSSMEVKVSAETFIEMLAKFEARECMLVVEDDSTVYGWGVVKKYSDRIGYRVACETSIYLDREQTGKGYGGALQGALLEKAAELEYHHVVAKIWSSNQGSIRFHERFGYEMVGVQKEIGFMGGRWRDVAIMQCLLKDVGAHRPDIA